MNVLETIRTDLTQALRAKDTVVLDTLRSVIAGCTAQLTALGKTPQDTLETAEVYGVLKKLIKQRRDAIAQFQAGGREDLVTVETQQLEVLLRYQPPQVSREEILAIAQEKKAALGITDKTKAGVLMGAVLKECNGAAESSTVKEVIDTLFI